ncbi:MAG: hypothetical protein ACFFC3_07525 [Candidatus Odinarchaeota archaeon]
MSEKYSNWLNKLKNKYQAEIDNLQEEEYRYLVTNYRFEGSTLLFILNFQFQLYNLTMLIMNHNSPFKESGKYLGSISTLDKETGKIIEDVEYKIDENEELQSIKQQLLNILENQLKRKIKPKGKGKYLGGGTIGRESWYYYIFEGSLEDISIDDFFNKAFREAKDKFQKKVKLDEDLEKRKNSIEKLKYINISDKKVKLFITEVRKNLEEITSNMTDDLKNVIKNRSLVIENTALEKYGFVPKDSNGCKLLKEIIPIKNLTIQADLDSRRFTIFIRGLYEYLVEEVLQKYITTPAEIEKFILKKLNEFINSYKTKKLPYTVILPLNGIIADVEESYEELTILFTEKAGLILFDDIVIITKNSDLNLGRSVHYNKDDIEKGVNRAISIYCKGMIDFTFIENNTFLFDLNSLRTEPESINDSLTWLEIRNIFASFILRNFKIGFSKQFYKFPWWIPKKRYHYDFPTPDWLKNVSYFNPSQRVSADQKYLLQIKDLIPESYRNITFLTPIDKEERIVFTKGNISDGIGFFKIDRGRSHEMAYREIHLKIPSRSFRLLILIYTMYSKKSSPINFSSSLFIINHLLTLIQREKIEDAILDSCLIMESLLISGDRELSYRFKLHASLLISNNINDLEKNIRFFDNLYELRSQIVHGVEGWEESYRKFLNKNTRWNFTKSEWNFDQIEFTRSEVLNLIFMKILNIIIRINEIGLSLEDLQNPANLIANLLFNPRDIDLKEFIKEKAKHPQKSQKVKREKLLKDLKRYMERLTSIIDSEKLKTPNWLEKLKIAINDLEKGNFDEFQKEFCILNIREWKPNSESNKIIISILSNLENIKKEYCLKNKNSKNFK